MTAGLWEGNVMQQLFDLNGKTELVPGVSNLGYDVAKALAKLGCRLGGCKTKAGGR